MHVLNMPTAKVPSARGFMYTFMGSLVNTVVACLPSSSWFTANTSALVSKLSVKSSIYERSQPSSKGAESKHQRLKCVYCSLGVRFVLRCFSFQATLPNTNISGSLNRPGLA